MAKIEDVGSIDLLPTSRKMMLAALLQRMNQPQPSPWGAAANALTMGLMGLIEKQDDTRAADLSMGTSSLLDRAISPDKPVGSTSIPSEPSLPPQALSGGSLSDTAAPLSGGTLPKGGIDRSQLASQLQDPAVIQRMASMVKGETGFKDPELAQIQTESALNRAQVRGIPLSEALLSVADNPKKGYYASDTYKRPASPQDVEAYRPILAKALEGSDLGTERLGFTPTGNASGPFALNREASGTYANSGWPSGRPGVGEMYATEKYDAPRLASLPRQSTLGPLLGGPTLEPQGQPSVTNVRSAPVQVAQAQQLQPPAIIKDFEAQAQAAYQKGDMLRAKAWADQANALKMEYFNSLQKLQLDAATKRNPTYSDLNPNLDIKQLPDGKYYAIDPKSGRPVRQVEVPGSAGRPTITLPNGQVVAMPEGANEQKWREGVTGEITQMTFPKPVDPSAAGRQAMADAAKAPLEKHKHVLLDDFDSKKTAQYYAFLNGLPGQGEVGLAYNALSARIQAGVYAATGSAAPESEEKRLMSTYGPTPWDSKELRAQKLQMLDDYLANYNENVKRGREMPGQPQQPQQPQQGNVAPEGTVVYGRNGETLVKRNGQWVQP